MTRTDFEKRIDKAYDYHPYSIPDVEAFGDWLAGPTFVLRAVERYSPRPGRDWSPFRPDPQLQLKVSGLLGDCKRAFGPIAVDPKGHKKDPIITTDQYGAEHPGSATKCTKRAFRGDRTRPLGELAFPLYGLGKSLGLEYKFNSENFCLYGFKEGELMAVFAGKRFDRCIVG